MSNSPKPYLDAPSCLDVLALAAATTVDQVEHRPPAAARGPGVRERVPHVRILETTEDCYAKREFARAKPYRVAADLVATAKDLAVTNVKQKPQERTVPGLGDVLLPAPLRSQPSKVSKDATAHKQTSPQNYIFVSTKGVITCTPLSQDNMDLHFKIFSEKYCAVRASMTQKTSYEHTLVALPSEERPKKNGLCIHNLKRTHCKLCKGSAICVHDIQRSQCKKCKGSQICVHNRIRGTCKLCNGNRLCIHGRQKAQCRDCKNAGTPGTGSQICVHNKRKSICKICKGSEICEHNLRKSACKLCKLVFTVCQKRL